MVVCCNWFHSLLMYFVLVSFSSHAVCARAGGTTLKSGHSGQTVPLCFQLRAKWVWKADTPFIREAAHPHTEHNKLSAGALLVLQDLQQTHISPCCLLVFLQNEAVSRFPLLLRSWDAGWQCPAGSHGLPSLPAE